MRRRRAAPLVGFALVAMVMAAYWLFGAGSSGDEAAPEAPLAPGGESAAGARPNPPDPFAGVTDTEEPDQSPIVTRAPPPPGPGTDPARTAAPSLPPAPGTLLIPVAGVRPEQLVDTYSQARASGRTHQGIDIAAARGTAVVAAGEGRVLKLFVSEQGGITLYQLAPDQRTVYYYAHLERYAAGIAEGMLLRPGQTLGYVGDTGNAGAGNYHLHFEITTTADPAQYWGGVPTNPYPRLRGATEPTL